MSIDLLEMIRGGIPRSFLEKLGPCVGADPEKGSSLFESAASVIMGGLIRQAQSSGGAENIFRESQNADPGLSGRLGELVNGGGLSDRVQASGSRILELLFGNGLSHMVESLSRTLGIDRESTGQLLKLVAPIVIAALGKHVNKKALNSSGLGSLLIDQKQFLSGYLPAGLESQFGIEKIAADAIGASGQFCDGTLGNDGEIIRRAGMKRLILPVLAIGALAAGAIWFFNRPPGEPPVAAPDANTGNTSIPGDDDIPGLDVDVGVMDVDTSKFDIGKLKDELKEITGSLEKLSEESVAGFAEKVNSFTEKLDSMGLENLDGIAKGLVQPVISSFRDMIKRKLEEISSSEVLSAVKPAVEAMMKKFESYGL